MDWFGITNLTLGRFMLSILIGIISAIPLSLAIAKFLMSGEKRQEQVGDIPSSTIIIIADDKVGVGR